MALKFYLTNLYLIKVLLDPKSYSAEHHTNDGRNESGTFNHRQPDSYLEEISVFQYVRSFAHIQFSTIKPEPLLALILNHCGRRRVGSRSVPQYRASLAQYGRFLVFQDRRAFLSGQLHRPFRFRQTHLPS